MFPRVKFPELVKHYVPHFSSVFSAEAWVEFERYISGLIVSENKTVDSINCLFVHESRNQSSLNRLLTHSPFELSALNQTRRGFHPFRIHYKGTKGLTSINCGTFRPWNGTWHWSPWYTVCCVLPNTTRFFKANFNGNSSFSLRSTSTAVLRFGSE